MFENTPSDRVQFRALGELQGPGACLICGSGTRDEGYVDLGVYMDYHGQCYLCVLCLIQSAEVINMLTADEAGQLRQQMSDMLTENAALKATVEENNERLAAFSVIFGDRDFGTIGPARVSGGSDREITTRTFNESGSGESETEESDSDDGRLISIGASEQDYGSSEDTDSEQPELFKL